MQKQIEVELPDIIE